MSTQWFNGLTNKEKAEVVLLCAQKVDARLMKDGRFYTIYHHPCNFYIEVQLYQDQLVYIKALRSDEDWQGYLDSIRICKLCPK